MSKRQKTIHKQYKRLNYQGWQLLDKKNTIRPNSGSETLSHLLAKSTAAKVAIDAGYRVASEVKCPDGEADILAFGLEDRKPIVIELENDLSEDVEAKKREQYSVGDVREPFIIDLDAAPDDPDELYTHIQDKTGLNS